MQTTHIQMTIENGEEKGELSMKSLKWLGLNYRPNRALIFGQASTMPRTPAPALKMAIEDLARMSMSFTWFSIGLRRSSKMSCFFSRLSDRLMCSAKFLSCKAVMVTSLSTFESNPKRVDSKLSSRLIKSCIDRFWSSLLFITSPYMIKIFIQTIYWKGVVWK